MYIYFILFLLIFIIFLCIAHASDCLSFIDDARDTDLWKIIDFLESIQDTEDVRAHCSTWREWVKNNPSSIPKKYHALENLRYKYA